MRPRPPGRGLRDLAFFGLVNSGDISAQSSAPPPRAVVVEVNPCFAVCRGQDGRYLLTTISTSIIFPRLPFRVFGGSSLFPYRPFLLSFTFYEGGGGGGLSG